MRRTLFSVALLLCICIAAGAQRKEVRSEVLADWNLSSGLDCVYDMSPKDLTPAPKGYRAVYISHYGRHGSRYAYTERAYTLPLDMLKEGLEQGNLSPRGEALLQDLQAFWDRNRYRVGDLSQLGWEQQAFIGATMVGDYPSAFGKGSVVDACSSPSIRAIMSMSACCASISRLSPKAGLYEHQSIMDRQATMPNRDNPFMWKGPDMPFPFAESNKDFMLRCLPGYEQPLARLFKNPAAAMKGRDVFDTFFHLYLLVGGMNSIQENQRVDVSGIFTPEEYAGLWEAANYAAFREYWAYRTAVSSILKDISAKADSRLASGQKGADLRFGHDHVLMALLMVLDLDGFGAVMGSPDELAYWVQTFRSPMAGNIQFVFYSPKRGGGDILIKVLLNGEEASLGQLAKAQGPYYRWSDVRDYLEARMAVFADEASRSRTFPN